MELVYIWVEDYKNIKHKEFNFGGDLTFSYVNGEITAKKNKASITNNFWGKKVNNISLVIGENGTGKSNLIKLIIDIYNDIDYHGKFFAIHKTTEGYFVKPFGMLDFSPNYYYKGKTKIDFIEPESASLQLQTCKTIFYDSAFNPTISPVDQLTDQINNQINLSSNFLYRDDHEKRELTPNKNEPSSTLFNKVIENFRQREMERQIEAFSILTNNETPFDVPDSLVITPNNFVERTISNLNESTLCKKVLKLPFAEGSFNEQSHTIEDIRNRWLMPFYKNALLNFLLELEYVVNFEPLRHDVYSATINRLLNSEQVSNRIIIEFFNDISLLSSEFLNEIPQKINLIITYLEKVTNYFEKSNYGKNEIQNDSGKMYENFPTYENSPVVILTDKSKKDLGEHTKNGIKEFVGAYFSTVTLNGYLDFKWVTGINEAPFSSGQMHLLNLYSRLLYAYKTRINGSDKIILLLDEPDNTLHPEWQRIFIDSLLNFLNRIFTKQSSIQIILTTHSPILSSDIPYNNICYLTKEGQYTPSQLTFGADIHSLYKNSFFLKDGLIGEFAKGKIKSLVNFFEKKLNTTQTDDIVTEWKQEDAKAFIEIIGEPVLKEALLDLYREHFEDDEIKESELERLRRENDALKAENDKLKNS